MTITRLIKHMVAIVGNTAKRTINVDYKVIIEVYFKVIFKRNIIFIRS